MDLYYLYAKLFDINIKLGNYIIIMSDPNGILFDKNTGSEPNLTINEAAQRFVDQLEMSNVTLSGDSDQKSDIGEATKRFVSQLLTIKIDGSTMDFKPIHDFFADPDNITADMFIVGKINFPDLFIDIPGVICMDINLTTSLHRSIKERKFKFINLLIDLNIDLFKLEPIIMPACATILYDDRYDPLSDLLDKFIDLKIPIHENNYACIYILASKGRIDLLEKIMKTYVFNNQTEIIGKICAVAVRADRVNILEYFMPIRTFDTIPDIIFEYFINGIKCGDNINVTKYFTSNCIQISQENYLAVKVARQFKRKKIIQYFANADPHVVTLLDPAEIREYGIQN